MQRGTEGMASVADGQQDAICSSQDMAFVSRKFCWRRRRVIRSLLPVRVGEGEVEAGGSHRIGVTHGAMGGS